MGNEAGCLEISRSLEVLRENELWKIIENLTKT